MPKLGSIVYHNKILGTFKILVCSLHFGQVLKLPGDVNQDVLDGDYTDSSGTDRF